MAEMTYLEAINLGISEEMARDEKVVIFWGRCRRRQRRGVRCNKGLGC